MPTIRIAATVENDPQGHRVAVTTNGEERSLAVPAKARGRGSSANGGELLCAALATCYCNDVFREAAPRGIDVREVSVQVAADFGAPGEPASRIAYAVRIVARADEGAIRELARHTDTVAEIHNTLRRGMAVTLERVDAVALP